MVVAIDEAKDGERPKKDAATKKRKYNAICLYVLGTLLIFAPTYIQVHMPWALTVSAVLTSACWLGAWFYSIRIFLNIRSTTRISLLLAVLCTLASILSYAVAYVGTKLFSDPNLATELRAGSFLFFFTAVSIFLLYIRTIAAFFAQNTGKIKTLFTAKHSVAAILGALALGTALFQFLQVLLQIIHR
jgi:hypothetical protein